MYLLSGRAPEGAGYGGGMPLRLRLLAACLPLAAAFLSCDLLSSLGGRPGAYQCGDFTGDHCYAEASVGDHATGFQTTITVAGVFEAGDGLITNELWLRNYTGGQGWIELGYKHELNGTLQYFWGRKDPATADFSFENIGPVPAAEVGTPVTFDVHQTGTDTFLLSIDGGVTRWSKPLTLALWSNASGGYVLLGMELGGRDGGQASLAMFVDNKVYDTAFHPRFANAGDFPGQTIHGPPYGGWLQWPDAGQGGVFSTRCCAP